MQVCLLESHPEGVTQGADDHRTERPPPRGKRRSGSISLRARFFFLLAVLAVLGFVPELVSDQAHKSVDGFATALEESGSLRYRLLQILIELEKPGDSQASARLEGLMSEQHSLLARSMSGDAKSDLAACPTRELCDRFRAHLDRWDQVIEPKLRAAMADPAQIPKVEPEIFQEVSELDLTVSALARVVQARAERTARYGVLASAGSMLLVGLVAVGIWSVFRRIERLRASADRADDDALGEEMSAEDEIGALAAALVGGIEAERERRRAEHRRSNELRRQQLATQECTEALSAWIAGQGSLDAALDELARATHHSTAELHRDDGAPAPDPTTNGASRTVALGFGRRPLGVLKLSGHVAEHEPSDDVLLDTVSQVVAIACLADRLIADKTEQGRLAMALSSVSARPTRSEFGASLGRLIAHDAAQLELYDDEGRVEDMWTVLPDRLERVATLCESPKLESVTVIPVDSMDACNVLARTCNGQQLAVPLSVGERVVGALYLARGQGEFGVEDVHSAEALAPVVASALSRVQLEARLRFAEQWSTLGAFGRMLAHEIKNPLNSLGLELQLLERRVGKLGLEEAQRDKLLSSIGVVKNELSRLTALTADYLSISPKSGEMAMSPVDLRAIASEVARAHAAAMAERHIQLSEQLGDEPAMIDGNAARLKQLLHNLIGNALDAMSGVPERRLTISIRRRDQELELSVRDTGPGISDPVAIFAPGFSTKPSGTGMGLAISQQIARQHGGRLMARALPAGGSEFTLVLTPARVLN